MILIVIHLINLYKNKLEKLSKGQDWPLKNLVDRSVRFKMVKFCPSCCQKTKNLTKKSVRHKFKEILFLVDVDNIFSELKLNRETGEKLCEVE